MRWFRKLNHERQPGRAQNANYAFTCAHASQIFCVCAHTHTPATCTVRTAGCVMINNMCDNTHCRVCAHAHTPGDDTIQFPPLQISLCFKHNPTLLDRNMCLPDQRALSFSRSLLDTALSCFASTRALKNVWMLRSTPRAFIALCQTHSSDRVQRRTQCRGDVGGGGGLSDDIACA